MTTLETIAMSKENPAEYLTELTLDLIITMLNQIDFERAYSQLAEKYPEIIIDDDLKEIMLGHDEFDKTFRNKDWLRQYMRDTGMFNEVIEGYQTIIDDQKQKKNEEEPETIWKL